MRKLLLLSVIVVALVACSNRGDVSNATKDQQLDTAAVVQRVEEIYGAVFKVYNEEDSLRNLGLPIETSVWERRNEFNTLYCSTEWNEAFNKVEEIHSLLNGWWERDYWIMGQDWHNLSISDIKVVSMDEEKAVVDFQLHNSDSIPTKPVRVIMVKENGIWKIDTFIDQANDDDWKKGMQVDVKKYYSHVIEIHSILNEFRKAMEQDWHNLSISDEKIAGMDYDSKDDVDDIDMSIEDEKVEAMEYNYTKAGVEFQLHNFDSTKSVRAIMVKKNGIWKIDTFIDEAGKDCKKEMLEYVKQNNHRAKNN